jgi:hypothetical protein
MRYCAVSLNSGDNRGNGLAYRTSTARDSLSSVQRRTRGVTPQSTFMVVAPVANGRDAELRALLAAMNALPGMADPANELVPFGRFERLHVARFLVLEAPTADDIVVYDVPPSPWPTSLVFLGDCDGPADALLAELVERAGPGLRRIFACCRDFSTDEDLLKWMQRHERRP